MSKWVPLTVHIRVVPVRPGKRWEYIRALQKLAVLAYEELRTLSGFQFAIPGGGQGQQFGDINRRGGFGEFAQGMAIKPQMGEVPSQLSITGFYQSSGANLQTYASHQVISGGEIYTVYDAHSNDALPTSTVNAEVKTVKTAIEGALVTAFPVGTVYDVFRIDYSGIVFGDKGFTFPQ